MLGSVWPMGERQVVIFLHALGAWPEAWDAQVQSLPAPYAGIAPTIAGVKEAGTVPFSFADAADDLVTVLDRQDADRTHLCGLSLGAMVATQFAIDHPARVASLVLSGSQVAPNPAMMAVQRAVIRLLPERTAAGFGLTKRSWLAMVRAVADADFRSRLHEIEAPTLVLCGSRDVANLPAARLLARTVPGAELKIIRGAGHEWNNQFPERFNDVIGDFYRSLGDDKRRPTAQ